MRTLFAFQMVPVQLRININIHTFTETAWKLQQFVSTATASRISNIQTKCDGCDGPNH